MIRVHNRHRRCTGLPLYGYCPGWGMMALAAAFGFLAIAIWSHTL